MAWYATTTWKDRILAALPYLLPLFPATVGFGMPALQLLPVLAVILIPILQPIALLYSIPFAGLLIFFALFLLVVRNPRVSYFIRYNTMQSLLIGIILSLFGLLSEILNLTSAFGYVSLILGNTIFLGTLAMIGFAIVQCCRGVYPEFPTISEAAKSQLG